MSQPRISIIACLNIMLFACASAVAADTESDVKIRMGTGDPVVGKVKAAMCYSCHGEDGNSTSPDYPKLAGQYAEYIQKQLGEFKTGVRKNPMMLAMSASIASEQDVLDISAYFASLEKMKGTKPVVSKAGKAIFTDAGNGCFTCHGTDGKGMAPDMSQAPVIGGQHKAYLLKQLNNFRSQKRTNDPGGMMGVIAGSMSNEDIESVASYISGL